MNLYQTPQDIKRARTHSQVSRSINGGSGGGMKGEETQVPLKEVVELLGMHKRKDSGKREASKIEKEQSLSAVHE